MDDGELRRKLLRYSWESGTVLLRFVCKGHISDLEEQESLYNVHQLPKRFGKINDDMVDMINTVAQGVSFEDACVMHHIEVNLIHFMRLFAKHLTPKKLIISLTNKHRDYELIESLQPRYDKTS